MTTYGVFIGIDRYDDPKIRNLGGAKRDATALWALFADTLPNFDARLLADDDASVSAVRHHLDSTLGTAGPDDMVILSFAGHGSRDHRLVFHDARIADVPGTSLSMSELAQRFKASKAGVVLCILDCCFSGEAPARVLEDSPATRDPSSPLEEIAGSGKVIIAACDPSQSALESPSSRHGLLTHALLRVLQEGDTPIGIHAALEKLMGLVRAEASALGYEQTPTVLGHVEGGLTIPVLKRGERFFAAFPECRQPGPISGALNELAAYGLPKALLDEWSTLYKEGLNLLQIQAVNGQRVLLGESLLVVAPTSSGKTLIGEMAAAKAISEGRKAAFLFPYKALVNEKFDQFTRIYAERLGHRVVRCTGDHRDQATEVILGKYDLAVLTYEMFLSLALGSPNVMNQLGLVVVDEVQFLTDASRGIIVELLLTRLRAARERGVGPQIVALSAVIGGLNGFDDWLGCEKLVHLERPVPLIEGVLDRHGTFQFKDTDGAIKREQLLLSREVIQRKEKPGAQDVIVPLVRKLLTASESERVLVFRNNRGSAEGCAAYLAADLGLAPASDALAQLPGHDLSSASRSLQQSLKGGTAFHTANLSREEREVVERAYRKPDGQIRALAATTTVAAGINTPASTVVFAEHEFKGEDGRPFTIAEYKNMAGRAGRKGYHEFGRSIILADGPHQREQLFDNYVCGTLDPMRSSFDVEHVETWVLRMLSQVRRVARDEAVSLLAATYGGFLAGRQDPAWNKRTTVLLKNVLDQMLSLDLVSEYEGYLELTLLGKAAGRSSLSFESVLKLLRLLRADRQGVIGAERLAALIQALPQLDSVYTPLVKKGTKESGWPRLLDNRFGAQMAQLLQVGADDPLAYIARAKRALLIASWIDGTPIEQIEQQYSMNPMFSRVGAGNVRAIADATRMHLRAAFDIAFLAMPERAPEEGSLDVLLRRLEAGLPEVALSLLDESEVLTRGECLTLLDNGISTSKNLWGTPEAVLARLLGRSRLAILNRSRPGGSVPAKSATVGAEAVVSTDTTA